MPKVPEVSPLTGLPVPSYYLHASDSFFRDTQGRAILLRGVNFTPQHKYPIGQPSHISPTSTDLQNLDFRHLNLTDGSLDEHLIRLRSWGFNCLRYIFTWEAIEHGRPGIYDDEFLEYTVNVLRKAKEYGFRVFMDIHQDCCSRFMGGSGAPIWAVEACGLNPLNFSITSAAYVHGDWKPPSEYPDMIWATNYTRLAASTMSILFFGGKKFAPLCTIDGENIQDWLQSHFLDACKQVLIKINQEGLEDSCVIGWDSFNEPNPTYIGLKGLDSIPDSWKFKKGPMANPLQSFKLGMGIKQKVENWGFSSLGPKKEGMVEIDPGGKKAWLTKEEDEIQSKKWGWKRGSEWPIGECLWAAHGVWDIEKGEVTNDDYFERQGEFVKDYWLDHWRKFSDLIRSTHKESIMFFQPPVFVAPPEEIKLNLDNRACLSSHFYDGLTLITKHWNWFNADAIGLLRGKYSNMIFAIRIGNQSIRKCIRDQLSYLRQDCLSIGSYPSLIGEIGIPFDLDGKKSYSNNDFQSQITALDASLNGCDGKNLLSYTIWSYCPDNNHEWGDNWNGEDLSIWSSNDSHSTSIYNGARAAEAFCRPYPIASVGTPISIEFDIKTSQFELLLDVQSNELGPPTRIFLPFLHYGFIGNRIRTPNNLDRNSTQSSRNTSAESLNSMSKVAETEEETDTLTLEVQVSSGKWAVEGQYLDWYIESGQIRQSIKIRRKGGTIVTHSSRNALGCGIF